MTTTGLDRVKVAVIGAGLMAGKHLEAFSDHAGVDLLGIFSRTQERALALAKKYPSLKVYDSIQALYAGTTADLVIIAVPELSVNQVCMQAFEFPWLALIEKPAGYNLEDAIMISEAAKRSKRRAYVALNRRHYSSTRAVAEEIEWVQGNRLVQVFDQENSDVALESGRPPLVVENWMYANSIHIIDYFNMFCRGSLAEVQQIIKWDPIKPCFVMTKLQYSSGDTGIYQATWNGPGPWGVSITTQAKRWEMCPLEQASSMLYKSRSAEPISLNPWDAQFKPGLRQQAEEAVKAARGEKNKLPTLAEGVATMKLVHLIYEA
jgi:hypothetical protein